MSPSRNDPCPCGSGKKYKRCCMARDEQASGSDHARAFGSDDGMRALLRSHEIESDWEASIEPVNLAFDDDPTARPAVLLVVASGLVLDTEILAHPPAEYADIAKTLMAGLARAEEATGRSPALVVARHAEVARELEPLLAARGAHSTFSPRLDQLDDALDALQQNVFAGEVGDTISRASAPNRWAGWGWPADRVAELFRTAADYFRAAPWRTVGDDEILTIATHGRTWYVSVLGAAGETFGLGLYTNPRDVEEIFERDSMPDDPFDQLHGAVLSLTFNRFDELPRGMHREVRAAGWEVAGPSAYPAVFAVNTPAGGVTAEQLDDLMVVTGAATRFVTANADVLVTDEALEGRTPIVAWIDEPTGATVSYTGYWGGADEPLWPVPERLATAGAEGRGAQPGAWFAGGIGSLDDDQHAEELERLRRYGAWLTVAKRTPTARKSIGRDVELATRFVLSVMDNGGLLAGVNEMDLRVFLYGDYPVTARRNTNPDKLLASLGMLFEFLSESEGIGCPWATPILADAEAFAIRLESCPSSRSRPAEREAFFTELSWDLGSRALEPVQGDVDWAAVRLEPKGRAALTLLSRTWLRWRDEIIRDGQDDPAEVMRMLIERRRTWEAEPNAALGGLTPAEHVAGILRASPAGAN